MVAHHHIRILRYVKGTQAEAGAATRANARRRGANGQEGEEAALRQSAGQSARFCDSHTFLALPGLGPRLPPLPGAMHLDTAIDTYIDRMA